MRSVAIAQKFMVITIVLHKNFSDVHLNLTVRGKVNEEIVEVRISYFILREKNIKNILH